jgi:membrane-associated phospholipid phosphatase
MIQFIMQMDQTILYWIQENVRNPFLTPIFIFITRLGNSAFIWLFTALVLLGVKKLRHCGVALLVSLIISSILVDEILKNVFCRIRPFNAMPGLMALIPKPGSYSFPSGHTTTAFAAATVIAICLPKKFGIMGYILAVLIGFSRMYLGVHYPSDVLAGIILGGFIGVVSVQLLKLKKE